MKSGRIVRSLQSMSVEVPGVESNPAWKSRNVHFQARLSNLMRYAKHGNVPILLEGSSGTGKTRLAKEIHLVSPRASRPFKELALSSIEDSLASSELFGHVAGAFTDARQTRTGAFISANSGTLFLDEIGKASGKVQLKLLGSVESGVILQQGSDREVRVDVRIISATNVSLDQLVSRGDFLHDLAARLGLFRITLPDLCDRREDIGDLAQQIVARRARAFAFIEAPPIEPDLLAALTAADWPLNIRQLDAVLQRLLLEASAEGSSTLALQHCVGDLAFLIPHQTPHGARHTSSKDVQQEIQQTESRAALAERLGISQATLYRRLRQQGDQYLND